MTALLVGLAGFVGLLTGVTAGAWLFGRRKQLVIAQPIPDSHVDPAMVLPQVGRHEVVTVVDGAPIGGLASGPRRMRGALRFGLVLVVASLVATVAGLVGTAHASQSQARKLAIAITGGDPD